MAKYNSDEWHALVDDYSHTFFRPNRPDPDGPDLNDEEWEDEEEEEEEGGRGRPVQPTLDMWVDGKPSGARRDDPAKSDKTASQAPPPAAKDIDDKRPDFVMTSGGTSGGGGGGVEGGGEGGDGVRVDRKRMLAFSRDTLPVLYGFLSLRGICLSSSVCRMWYRAGCTSRLLPRLLCQDSVEEVRATKAQYFVRWMQALNEYLDYTAAGNAKKGASVNANLNAGKEWMAMYSRVGRWVHISLCAQNEQKRDSKLALANPTKSFPLQHSVTLPVFCTHRPITKLWIEPPPPKRHQSPISHPNSHPVDAKDEKADGKADGVPNEQRGAEWRDEQPVKQTRRGWLMLLFPVSRRTQIYWIDDVDKIETTRLAFDHTPDATAASTAPSVLPHELFALHYNGSSAAAAAAAAAADTVGNVGDSVLVLHGGDRLSLFRLVAGRVLSTGSIPLGSGRAIRVVCLQLRRLSYGELLLVVGFNTGEVFTWGVGAGDGRVLGGRFCFFKLRNAAQRLEAIRSHTYTFHFGLPDTPFEDRGFPVGVRLATPKNQADDEQTNVIQSSSFLMSTKPKPQQGAPSWQRKPSWSILYLETGFSRNLSADRGEDNGVRPENMVVTRVAHTRVLKERFAIDALGNNTNEALDQCWCDLLLVAPNRGCCRVVGLSPVIAKRALSVVVPNLSFPDSATRLACAAMSVDPLLGLWCMPQDDGALPVTHLSSGKALFTDVSKYTGGNSRHVLKTSAAQGPVFCTDRCFFYVFGGGGLALRALLLPNQPIPCLPPPTGKATPPIAARLASVVWHRVPAPNKELHHPEPFTFRSDMYAAISTYAVAEHLMLLVKDTGTAALVNTSQHTALATASAPASDGALASSFSVGSRVVSERHGFCGTVERVVGGDLYIRSIPMYRFAAPTRKGIERLARLALMYDVEHHDAGNDQNDRRTRTLYQQFFNHYPEKPDRITVLAATDPSLKHASSSIASDNVHGDGDDKQDRVDDDDHHDDEGDGKGNGNGRSGGGNERQGAQSIARGHVVTFSLPDLGLGDRRVAIETPPTAEVDRRNEWYRYGRFCARFKGGKKKIAGLIRGAKQGKIAPPPCRASPLDEQITVADVFGPYLLLCSRRFACHFCIRHDDPALAKSRTTTKK